MKVLITGASGFIGQFIGQYLLDNNIDLITIGRTKPKNIDTNHIFFDLVAPDFTLFNDNNTNIDTIIHCSSVMADNTNLESFQLLNDNIKMSESIVELSKKLKIKQLINLSSFAIYPNKDGHYDESSQLDVSDNNDSMYGLSKICAENLYNFLLGKKNNISVVNLRISQVHGRGMRSDRTYKIMLDELKEKNTITAFSDGERVSNFISATKLAKVIHFFLNHQNYTGPYNVGGENLSYKALAQQLIEKYGNQDSKIILVSRGVKSKFYLNTDKLDQLLKSYGQTLNND
jgi:nucleoside-diphosphate-sugar epimerase